MATAPKRDKDIVAYTGFTGLRNSLPTARFALSDLEVASNIDLDESGMASRRAGRTSVLAGDVHSLWSEEDVCLFVQASTLKRLSTAYTASTLKTLASNARMAYQKVDERVYFTNETDTGVLENGAARSWGIEPPPAIASAVTVGYMPAGDYQATMTYVREDGQESGAGLATRITVPAGAGLDFTLPVSSDPGVAAKIVYLSTANGEVLYRALFLSADETTASYTNDTTELALELQSQFLSAPPAGHLLGYFQGCMYVAVGDTVYPSEPYAHEWFDLRKFISFDAKVTLFAPIEDEGVFIGTEKSIGWMPGSGPEAFRYVRRASYGAILGALDYVEADKFSDGALGARDLPMWLSTKGVCVGLPGGSVQNLTDAKYSFTAQGSGCALYRSDTSQLIAVANH
jgi:hypothetical protein